MHEQINQLEKDLDSCLPANILALIYARSNYYSEIASGWTEVDLRKAGLEYIKAMESML
jgi:hypothetical protein